jgi:hypothetical protein
VRAESVSNADEGAGGSGCRQAVRRGRSTPLARRLVHAMCGTVAAAASFAACRPTTTRPPFPPVPEAASTEIQLSPAEATRVLDDALRADSIPVTRVEQRDTWLESAWFDARSGHRTNARPLGLNVVRVRAWADPTHPGNCKVWVETIYRPLADPSLPVRELDRQVPRNHPVAVKVRATLQELVKRYGGPPAQQQQQQPSPTEQPEDQDTEQE